MFEQITGMIIGAFDVAFAPLIAINPVLSLFAVSLIVTLLSLFFNQLFINKDVVKSIKDGMEEIREAMTKAQKAGDTAQVTKHMNDIMSLNNQYFKQTYKSLFISLIIVLIFLPWMGVKYDSMILNIPVVGSAIKSFSIPVLGSEVRAWLLWYILISFTIGWVLRKMLGFD